MKNFSFVLICFLGLYNVNYSQSECIKTLVQSYKNTSIDLNRSFILNDLINRHVSESQRKGLNIMVPINDIPINLNSERMKNYSINYYRQTNMEFDENTKINIISQTLDEKSVDAYKTCIEGTSHVYGPRLIAYDCTPKNITVKLFWKSVVSEGNNTRLDFEIDGGNARNLPRSIERDKPLIIQFNREPCKDFRLVVKTKNGDDDVFVPWIPNITMKDTTIELYFPARPKRLANDGSGKRVGPITNTYYAPDGWEILPGSVSVNMLTFVALRNGNSWVRIIKENYNSFTYKAVCNPITKQGGGDMSFQIGFKLRKLIYKIECP